jgi:hypothetical protein
VAKGTSLGMASKIYARMTFVDMNIKNAKLVSLVQIEMIKRLHSLLTIKESAASVPKNLEARRRLQFFTNSLFMRMPHAKPVSEMLSFR